MRRERERARERESVYTHLLQLVLLQRLGLLGEVLKLVLLLLQFLLAPLDLWEQRREEKRVNGGTSCCSGTYVISSESIELFPLAFVCLRLCLCVCVFVYLKDPNKLMPRESANLPGLHS